MNGTFVGIRYRVAGRVVMGMTEHGATYYWNEFNLVGESGQCATLVYEEEEHGGQWRLFTLFEPQTPMTAQEASAKRVGDTVNLEGTPLRVALVDESQVHHIEGQAAEGVELGDVAHYFNAERGTKMFVVSWTGEDVEFYRGMNLPRSAVLSAFGIDAGAAASFVDTPVKESSSDWSAMKIIALIAVVAIGLGLFFQWQHKRQGNRPRKPRLSSAPLAIGSSGRPAAEVFRIRNHQIVEIAQVGQVYDRHEYELVNDKGETALLVYPVPEETGRWYFFEPISSAPKLTSAQAATFHAGQTALLDGAVAVVFALFRSTVQQQAIPANGQGTANVRYGFMARQSPGVLMVRWDEQSLTIYRGMSLADASIRASFKP
jgi:hypothetical protein